MAWSLPLGAGRLTREHFADGPPEDKALRKLRTQIRTAIAHDAGTLLRRGAPDHAVATSKTFRSLARICGAAPSSEGPFVRRILPAAELDEWIPKLLEMSQRRRSPSCPVSPATGLTRWSPGHSWPRR